MKRMIIMFVALGALTTAALAADPLARGKELFNSKQLGTNGKSCASCHPGGEQLEEAGAYNETQLVKIVNQCIQKSLAGKALPDDSADMKALIAYIRTFSKP
jgi:cytochrome c